MDERTLFGTDGVRGVANRHPMTIELASRLGRALGYRLRDVVRGRRPKVLIGKDTRLSGYMMEMALGAGLTSAGADVHLVGPLPTPGVAFLTEGMRADAGVMISASHNPFEDNGLKLFARDGYKLPDADELAIERLLEHPDLDAFRPTGTDIGRAFRIDDAAGRYAVFAKSAFPRDLTLEGLRVVVDCGNGAGYKVAPEVLRELGADVVALGVSPNGTNINAACGALHPGNMAEVIRERRADVGVALDGDADRCIMADEQGRVVDGDQMLAVMGRTFLDEGRLVGKTVVATVMSNLGLDEAIRDGGGTVVRVGVGDRYVVERMRADGLSLGGEQSGHVILREHGTTGDGLVTALVMLGIMVRSGKPLSELAGCMRRFPQVLTNIQVQRKPPIDTLPKVREAIDRAEARLEDNGRVLVRYSGTQMLARVMVEGPEQGLINQMAAEIASALDTAVG